MADKYVRVGSTYGLNHFNPDREHEAEQIYVDEIVGGRKDTKHVIALRKARGYTWPVVLELTERQALDLAKILIEHFNGASHPESFHLDPK